MNIQPSDPRTPWLARAAAFAVAALLHAVAWYGWSHRPVTTPARVERTVEVALLAPQRPQVQPQPPQPPKPPDSKSRVAEKPAATKPKPLPKPAPLKQAAQAPVPEPEAAPPPAAPAPTAPAPAPFQEANYKAAYLQNPPPRYPAIARERHWQGEVLIRTQILADGSAGELHLERSSGHDALDEAAMDAVKQWRFVPAKEGDKAVASWVIIPIDFKLKN